MTDSTHHRVVIIGSGPAGLTAAIYAARAGLDPIMISGMEPGGQMTITTDVENYPGFAEIIQGPWLMEQMQVQAKAVGAEILYDMVVHVDFTTRPFSIVTDDGKKFLSDTAIITTGAQARWLGLESEETFKGFGVSACATCDGFFFRGKSVVVVGGGNTAVEEALYLTNHAKSVTLVHRRDTLRAEKILQKRLFDNEKINVIWDSEVTEILGNSDPKSVHSVRLRNVGDGSSHVINCDGVFVAIGHSPSTALFQGKLGMDDGGYIISAPDSTKTSINGVFAAGDVTDHTYRQAITAAGMGCMAALEVEKYLAELPNSD
ncbi:MAG: thioredoxin-disulfide reductase [Pseudomonadota bacterium]